LTFSPITESGPKGPHYIRRGSIWPRVVQAFRPADAVRDVQATVASSEAVSSLTETLLASGSCVRFRASGGSMHPTIRDGDVLVLAPIDPSELRTGAVVLARQSGRLVAHRIADVTKTEAGTQVLLRGDALPACPPTVSADAVMARVVGIERGGHRLAVDAARITRFIVRATVLLARICWEAVSQRHIESY
jgi:signal peptidase I